MANIKISELGSAASVADANTIPMTASGVTVGATAKLLKDYAVGTTDISNVGSTVTGAISNVAGIESDAWASGTAYVAGQYRIYNNKIYKCLVDHTSSSSILPTNTTYWEPTTIGKELYAQNVNLAVGEWRSLTTGAYASGIFYRKIGEHLVQINFAIGGTNTITAGTTLATLPEDICPSRQMSACVLISGQTLGLAIINTSGEITYTAPSATATYIYGGAIYSI